jgi:hypothetical protein
VILNRPVTGLEGFIPFSLGKGSRGRFNRARDGVSTAPGRASREPRQSTGEPGETESGGLMPIRRKPVLAQGPPLGLGCSYPLYPSFVSAKPAA